MKKKQLTKTKEQQQPTHANPMNPQQKRSTKKQRKQFYGLVEGKMHRKPQIHGQKPWVSNFQIVPVTNPMKKNS